MTRGRRRRWILAILLALAAVGCELVLLLLRATAPVTSGDEGTYLAMTASLVGEGDLEFSRADRERVEAAARGGRKALILQLVGERLSYSKSAVFPLLAAPLAGLAGDAGPIVLNLAALAAALALAWAALARVQDAGTSAVWTVTFAGTSVLLPYAVWVMSDSLQSSLVLAGLALALAAERGGEGPLARLFASAWAPFAGGICLGVVTSMRLPNLLLALGPLAALAWKGSWRRAARFAAGVALGALVALAVNHALTGSPIPYTNLRATFNPDTGYPAGGGVDDLEAHFEKYGARHRLGLFERVEPEVTLYSAAYFLVGRHTGLLLYFPAALALGWAAWRRRDRLGLGVAAGVAALAAFYLVFMARNYFGGSTFLGNRYFLTGYAALLLAPARLPGLRAAAAVWLVAALAFVSAVASVTASRELDAASQNHAYAGVFRLLPYETTAQEIDGRRDRYWTEEFFRFVDPWPEVLDNGFVLRSGRPAAELLHASQSAAGLVRFLVSADGDGVKVVYRRGLTRRSLVLPAAEIGSWGVLEVPLAPSWRRHPFWFERGVRLPSRVHRLALRTRGGEPRLAALHYLGALRLDPKFFRGVPLELELPPAGRAGGATRLALAVHNSGERFWFSDDMIPAHVGYRLYALPRRPGAAPAAGALAPIDPPVFAGGELRTDLTVRWPDEPGRYQLVVDLILGGAAWFESWNGEPLGSGVVRVRPSSVP